MLGVSEASLPRKGTEEEAAIQALGDLPEALTHPVN